MPIIKIRMENIMKIILSSDGTNKDSNLDKRFGRCEFFVIYDTEKDTYEAVVNSGINASGGAGIKAANQVIELGTEVLITGSLGPNAFELIEKSDIKAFSSEVMTLVQAIAEYKEGNLNEIKSAGFARH